MWSGRMGGPAGRRQQSRCGMRAGLDAAGAQRGLTACGLWFGGRRAVRSGDRLGVVGGGCVAGPGGCGGVVGGLVCSCAAATVGRLVGVSSARYCSPLIELMGRVRPRPGRVSLAGVESFMCAGLGPIRRAGGWRFAGRGTACTVGAHIGLGRGRGCRRRAGRGGLPANGRARWTGGRR